MIAKKSLAKFYWLRYSFSAIVFMLVTLFVSPVQASSFYRVEATNPDYVSFGNINLSGSNNKIGQIVDGEGSDTGGAYSTVCLQNNGNAPLYQTSEYFSPVVAISDSYNLVQVNDYLNAGIAYSSGGIFYFPNDSTRIADSISCTDKGNHLPSSYLARLQIRKPFIGNMDFDIAIGRQCQGTQDKVCTQHADAWQTIAIRGSVTVPQTCDVIPGSVFDIDLGQIGQSAFIKGGAGNKPAGFNDRPLTIKVQCSGGVEADALINVRLEGAEAANYPHALASDNTDVGVVVTKNDGTVLVPNDESSVIPMQLEEGRGDVVIHAYPISLTGAAPAIGQFTTLAYLRFDFS
ncbi:fimbrial protein [Klebsiella aerogenes]|uniref:fimbrial protein n=1 Tax=Klebsiella aerogenes TaxID=548 RepID=UPI0021CEBE53|nr:fimbrial protein [Klebsiella aerogenes]MCU6317029.1 fimbrial protein [Klebsiella aerogenes]